MNSNYNFEKEEKKWNLILITVFIVAIIIFIFVGCSNNSAYPTVKYKDVECNCPNPVLDIQNKNCICS